MSLKNHQVFFDSTGRRSTLVYGLVTTILVALGALISVFLISVATSPALPSVRLDLDRQYLSVLAVAHRKPARIEPKIDLAHARSRIDNATSGTPRYAFYVNWDKNSFLSLRASAKHLDGLMPEWLHLSGDAGEVELDDEREQQNVDAWISINAPHLQVLPVVNNFDPQTNTWQGEAAGRLLRSSASRARLIRNLKNYLAKGEYEGVVIDFKEVAVADQLLMVEFLREVKAALAPDRRQVLSVLPGL